MIFLKKTPVIVLNLKFLRVIFLLCTFFMSVFICTTLSQKLFIPCVPHSFVESCLCQSPAFFEKSSPEKGVFLLLKKVAAKPTEEKKEEETLITEKPLLQVATHISDKYADTQDVKIEIHKKINTIDSYEKFEEVKKLFLSATIFILLTFLTFVLITTTIITANNTIAITIEEI